MILDNYSHPWSRWFEKLPTDCVFRLAYNIKCEPKTIRRFEGLDYCGTYRVLHTSELNGENYLVMERVRDDKEYKGNEIDSMGDVIIARFYPAGKNVELLPPTAAAGMKIWNEYRKNVNG